MHQAQVGFYALFKGCKFAGLVLPVAVSKEWAGHSGDVDTFRVRFDLARASKITDHGS
jgi:hypothetical protein